MMRVLKEKYEKDPDMEVFYKGTVAKLCIAYGCTEETASGYVKIVEQAGHIRIDYENDRIYWISEVPE